MNLNLFSRRGLRVPPTGPRRGRVWVAAVAGALLLFGVFQAGVQTGVRMAQPLSVLELRYQRAELDGQVETLEELRSSTRQTLDALAQRIGRLHAHVIRLDALGSVLTRMAGIDEEEFGFGGTPGLGGPGEYVRTTEALQWQQTLESLDELAAQIGRQSTELVVLEGLLTNRELRARTQPEGRPVAAGWISSGFGRRNDPFTGRPAQHSGIDFAGQAGTAILAAADGVVIFSGTRAGYGRLVEISHGNGYVTRYAHNRENLVQPGEVVVRGQEIARMGATGRATGTHLHFEVLRDGQAVNPMRYVNAGR